MSASITTIIGRLGGDPETKTLPSGTTLCEFSVAVDYGYGDHKGTSWYRVVFFGKRAESIGLYFSKGSPIWVSGEHREETWNKDGETKRAWKLVGGDWSFVPQDKNAAPAAVQPVTRGLTDSDIPF